MEKLFLGSFFIGKELNVIDQQGVNGAVVTLKLFDGVVLQRFNHVLNETLGVHIDHFRVRLTRHNAVPHRVQQVSFTQTRPAIEEQGVVGAARVIRHLTRRRAGQLVRFTFDEVIKRVFHVNVRAVGRLRRRRDIIPARAHDRRRRARGLHLRRRNGRRSRAYRPFLQRAGGLSAHLKTQLRGVRTAKIIEESIDIIEVFVPYPVEHKTVWRIQCQRVIAQFRLQWADPHAEFCGW